MKKLILTACVLFLSIGAFAQRYAYVDSEYILKQVPEYVSAQKQLDAMSQQWQKQVDAKFSEVDKLYKAYQADQVLLTEEMRKRRENDIIEKEKAVKEFQRSKFGFDGELAQERAKLIKPIQEKVSKAVKAVAENKQLEVVFDRSSESSMMIYASVKLDVSNEVLAKLGLKPAAIAK